MCALLIGVCVIILSISIITGNSFADALSDGINALGEGLFALLMGEVFGIGLKLKETHKGVCTEECLLGESLLPDQVFSHFAKRIATYKASH